MCYKKTILLLCAALSIILLCQPVLAGNRWMAGLAGFSTQAQNRQPFVDKGYAGDIELGALVLPQPFGTISTTHGYCFGRGWFAGVGGMFDCGSKNKGGSAPRLDENGNPMVPYEGNKTARMFFDLRKTFSLGETMLFADIKYGMLRNLDEAAYSLSRFSRFSAGVVLLHHVGISAGLDCSNQYYNKTPDVILYKPVASPFVSAVFVF